MGRRVQNRTLDRNAQADLVKLDRRFERFEYGERAACLAVTSTAASSTTDRSPPRLSMTACAWHACKQASLGGSKVQNLTSEGSAIVFSACANLPHGEATPLLVLVSMSRSRLPDRDILGRIGCCGGGTCRSNAVLLEFRPACSLAEGSRCGVLPQQRHSYKYGSNPPTFLQLSHLLHLVYLLSK